MAGAPASQTIAARPKNGRCPWDGYWVEKPIPTQGRGLEVIPAMGCGVVFGGTGGPFWPAHKNAEAHPGTHWNDGQKPPDPTDMFDKSTLLRYGSGVPIG
jgi:hypothetical protein